MKDKKNKMESGREIKKALNLIIKNQESKALNWAIGYTKACFILIDKNCSDNTLHTQLLYILSNMTHWRGEDAKTARGILKKAVKELQS